MTERFFTWVSTLSLFLLLASLLARGILSFSFVWFRGSSYYMGQLTVLAAASFASLVSALAMLYAPKMLPRVPPLLRKLIQKLIPRTRMAKVNVIAFSVLVLCFTALAFWPRPDPRPVPDLVQEYERDQKLKQQSTATPTTLDPPEVEILPKIDFRPDEPNKYAKATDDLGFVPDPVPPPNDFEKFKASAKKPSIDIASDFESFRGYTLEKPTPVPRLKVAWDDGKK
jgi:hypothetical protein